MSSDDSPDAPGQQRWPLFFDNPPATEEVLVISGDRFPVVLKFDDTVGNPTVVCDAEVQATMPSVNRWSSGTPWHSAPSWKVLAFGRKMNGECYNSWDKTWDRAHGVCILSKNETIITWNMSLARVPMVREPNWHVHCYAPTVSIIRSERPTGQ